MTDLDSPKKNNDCYFYYYSTCAKGDSCTFRHEPSALGCETMCSFWKEGKCLNVHCNFRHMELRKNRKAIQCYWEQQPGGCLKPHCPFLHQNVKQNAQINIVPSKELRSQSKENIGHVSDNAFKNPVDALVVNFEEESDSESMPTSSPTKASGRKIEVKTLEEIRLEKVQQESAAYFSYQGKATSTGSDDENESDLRQRILVKLREKQTQQGNQNITKEIEPIAITEVAKTIPSLEKRKLKFSPLNEPSIKIKTLAEIRAERRKKQLEQTEPDSSNKTLKRKTNCSETDDEVSSTSKDEIDSKEKPLKRIKLKRLSSAELKLMTRDDTSQQKTEVPEKIEDAQSQVMEVIEMEDAPIKINEEVLLLEDDEDYSNVTLTAEDDLFDEIDNLLGS